MTDKINGRTPEEIYKALRCVITQINDDCEDTCDSCKNCPNNFDGGRRELAVHLADAIVRIQQLERERDKARDDLDKLSYANTELHSAYEAMKREHDAAVEYLAVSRYCMTCTYDNVLKCDKCKGCFMTTTRPNWQWRGVQEV